MGLKPLLCTLACALACALALSGCLQEPPGPATERPASDPQPVVREADVERRVHDDVQAERRRRGLRPYRWREDLARTARDHSRDMVRGGYFAHVSPDGRTPTDRATAHGVRCRTQTSRGRTLEGVSENLFRSWLFSGYQTWTQDGESWRTYDWRSSADLAREAVGGWLDSRSHREALLDADSQAHGIGVAIGSDGVVLVTQVMC